MNSWLGEGAIVPDSRASVFNDMGRSTHCRAQGLTLCMRYSQALRLNSWFMPSKDSSVNELSEICCHDLDTTASWALSLLFSWPKIFQAISWGTLSSILSRHYTLPPPAQNQDNIWACRWIQVDWQHSMIFDIRKATLFPICNILQW